MERSAVLGFYPMLVDEYIYYRQQSEKHGEQGPGSVQPTDGSSAVEVCSSSVINPGNCTGMSIVLSI